MLPIIGSISLALVCALWAAASNTEARRIQLQLRNRIRDTESRLEQSDAVLSSDPGLILIWGEADGQSPSLPVPAADLPRGMAPMAPNHIAGDFEAVLGRIERTPAEQFRTFMVRLAPTGLREFAEALDELRGRGTPFSMVVKRKDHGEFDITGQTIGPRAIVRVRDVTNAVREVGRLGALLEDANASSRDLSALLHSLPAPIWRRNDKAELAWVNSAFVAAVKASSPEEVIEKKLELEAGGNQLALRVQAQNTALSERHQFEMSGAKRTMDLAEAPIPGGSGGIALDHTEVEELSRALEENDQIHERTLDKLETAVAIFGPDKNLRFSNASFAALWHLDHHWLESLPSHSEILEQLREARRLPEQRDFRNWKESRFALYTEAKDVGDETWHLPDGRSIHIVCRPHPMGGLIFLYEEVTERLALESNFNTLIEVQRKTLDNLDEGVALYGTNGRLALHNKAFAKLWQLKPEQLEGEPHINDVIALSRDLFDEEDEWRKIRARVTGSEEGRTSVKRRINRTDGTVLQFEVQPLRSGQTLVTFLDLTAAANIERALREKNMALEAADSLKTAFIENVSYQLRNPLTSILGFSEMLESGLAGTLSDQQNGYVGNVIEGAKQLRDLIDDILDLSMIEAGTLNLDLSEVEILELLKQASTSAVTRAEDSAVNVTLDVDENIGWFLADEKRLRQVLFNLLSNATQHTDDGGHVVLGAKREEGQVRIWVSDTGTGIDAEDQMRAFDSFASGEIASGGRRAGLGLALVKNFIELHGGWVSLESRSGQGTTVTCMIPERALAVDAAE